MGNTLPILPVEVEEEEERAVVNRFIQASRDIAPTVQVTLAKRIMRTGSNRLVCLAAQTSVPLNEDELASVSDLALRLSDGTNVKLSLSFFNDTNGGAEIVPLTRCIYDPQRYEIPRRSNFGLFWAGLALVSLASFCFFLKNPIGPQMVLHAPLKHIASAANETASKKVLTGGAARKALALTPRISNPPTERPLAMPTTRPAGSMRTAKEDAPRRRTFKKEHFSSGSMFVPPPPPTAYSPVFPMSPASFDPLQMMSPMSAPSKPSVSSSKPAVTKWLPKPDSPDSQTIANGTAAVPSPKAKSEPAPLPVSPADAPTIALERINPAASASSSGAPLPGSP